MRFILGKNGTNRDKLGGKAGALAALSSQDVTVPAWFAVSPDAMVESCQDALLPFSSSAPGPTLPASLPVAPNVRGELEAALDALCPDANLVAVRSSALDEDGDCASFAGQLDTFLFVHPDDVPEKVVAVWRSAFSESVVEYRRQKGLPPIPRPPAVVVQRMIDASVSGVVFGIDPVSGNPDVAVVSSVYGLGTSLVSGECDADTHYVDRAGSITKRTIANKVRAHRGPLPGESGIRIADVDPAHALKPALTDEQVLRIARLARDLEKHFGKPQDIEWAIAGGQLYVLQSRPITAAPAPSPQDGVRNIWDNSNIVESYNGVTTPLTFSFASYVYDEVYRQFCRILRVPERRIEEHASVFRNMLGLMQGRVYYNLLNWYRVLALLPGFQVNRTFMEQMMGVKSSLPEDVIGSSIVPDWRTRFVDCLYLVRSTVALVMHHLRLEATIHTFHARLRASLTADRHGFARMRAEELVAYYSTVESKLLKRWDAPLINDFLAMIFFGLLGRLCEKWLGNKSLANDLLCGQDGLISVEPSRRMLRMARQIANNESFARLLCEGTVSEIREAMIGHTDFAREYGDYLEEFGDRCIEELKLESPTLHDDPLPLLRGVGSLALRAREHPASAPIPPAHEAPREAADRLLREKLSPWSLKGRVFRYVLRHAKARVRDRENLRFERTRVFGLVRRIFVTLGHRLHEVGALDAPEDVFYLERHEVFGFIEGRATTARLRELVATRRREFAAYREASALPNRFETRGIVCANAIHPQKLPTGADDTHEERAGIGCCAGVVQGRVRIIIDPRRDRLQPGEILAAKTTDPGWIVHFSAAAGLLVERGSLLSHSAIVSRELGIPGIVSIEGLTSWLHDGDWVELNGTTGVVRRLAAGEAR
ncbi:MAG: phosphoenolpyruvate synthase [Candidatus Hydrogenedentes bacterium]|nr:phosphoenolpyruvate synthase [Candidatus Hydrogenedentota bacterium]